MTQSARPAMSNNLLILRASPDWLTFDLESSRDFLRPFGLPENLIIDFATLWKNHFKLDYCSVRAQLKALALETYAGVRRASLLRHQDWDGRLGPDRWVAFVDDDDWMSPGLFENLPSAVFGRDGVRWGSLRVGRLFAPNGYGEPIIQRRTLDSTVYTNNYAVSAAALGRLGRTALFEHDAAQRAFDRADFALIPCEKYLSCAVKHPCCTMSANYLMKLEGFRSDPRREMSLFMDAVDAVRLDAMDDWVRQPFAQFRAIMADAIRSR